MTKRKFVTKLENVFIFTRKMTNIYKIVADEFSVG